MWTNIFATYVTDRGALLVHGYLLALSVLATVCCIRGILWEVSGPLNVHEFARKLVIWGVSFEAIFTIALFIFDEGLSGVQRADIDRQQSIIRSQNDKIIALETRLTRRKIVDQAAFIKTVSGAPPPTSFWVRYVEEPDSSLFSTQLFLVLLTAHWPLLDNKIPVAPITKSDAIYPPHWGIVSPVQSAGANMLTGVTITAKVVDSARGTPTIDALQMALTAEIGKTVYRSPNDTLPDGAIVIVVAPKE